MLSLLEDIEIYDLKIYLFLISINFSLKKRDISPEILLNMLNVSWKDGDERVN